jgi:drug/metabolite transporter (DMT)-like permease
MILGMLSFSVMDGLAKWLVVGLPLLQILALRSALMLVLMTPLVRRAGGWRSLRTRRPWAHAMRAGYSLGALLCFFEALRHVPLATCVALVFSSPLFMTIASVVLLKERVGPHRWVAVLVGFIGVLIIVRPDTGGVDAWAAGLAVLSSLFFALSMITVRWLARTETEAAILIHQNIGVMLVGLVALPFVWTELGLIQALGIVAIAAAATGGQICTVRAFRIAPIGVVAPFEYMEMLWATLIGWLFWREFPDAASWTGATIIVASGLYMIWRERLTARQAQPG